MICFLMFEEMYDNLYLPEALLKIFLMINSLRVIKTELRYMASKLLFQTSCGLDNYFSYLFTCGLMIKVLLNVRLRQTVKVLLNMSLYVS